MLPRNFVAKIHHLMTALQSIDLEALKKFGAPRIPDPEHRGTLGANSPSTAQQRQFQAQALAVREAPPPQTYTQFTTNNRFEAFHERGSMEPALWSLEAERAHQIYNIAMMALIIGALITIAATIALVWVSSVKNQLTNAHYAMAIAASDRAKADAAQANERAAEFLLRAQQANVEQEKTRLQIEQVRKLTAGRRVSADQNAKILKVMRGHPMDVVLLSSSGDQEASVFADDIAKVLTEAGATVKAEKSILPIPTRGLGMSMSNSAEASTLFMAFRSAGFEIKDLPEKNPVMIVVGTKPPAPIQ